jgi:hypothetical protein
MDFDSSQRNILNDQSRTYLNYFLVSYGNRPIRCHVDDHNVQIGSQNVQHHVTYKTQKRYDVTF